jgi:hypothetical protein
LGQVSLVFNSPKRSGLLKMEDDDIERTLCQLPQVHVFKIPARKSAEGHRASDWPKEPNWTGKLKIVSRGRTCMIVLFDDNNQTFASCKVTDDTAVERTLDSGRYFVLRITNPQGRHAFIGIAFNERNDAFDFNVALSEFKNELEREAQASKFFENSSASADLSLKQGEKIKIKLNPKKPKSDETDGTHKSIKSSSGGLLPPPDMRSNTFALNNFVNASGPLSTGNAFQQNTVFSSSAAFAADPFSNDPFAAATTTTQATSLPKSSSAGSTSLLDF